jgi:hypothetical protein
MLQWRDTSIGEHVSFQAQVGAVCLIVLWSQERGWQTRCEPFFGFWPHDLNTSDLDEAKHVACDMLSRELQKSISALG